MAVCERELAAAGWAHLDPAEIAALRVPRSGPRPTALMRGCCAAAVEAGSRVVDSARTCGGGPHLGRLYCALMDERRPGSSASMPSCSTRLLADHRAAVGARPRCAVLCRAVGGGTPVRGHRAARMTN